MSRAYNLIAVPLFEIFENSQRFGPLVASLPHVLSRLDLSPVSPAAADAVPAGTDPSSTGTASTAADSTAQP